MGAVGIGALISAYSLAVRSERPRTLQKMIPISATMLGGGLIVFALSKNLWLSLVVTLILWIRHDATNGR